MPFELISRDVIHGLLLSAVRMFKKTGCFIGAVVFARRVDAEQYLGAHRPARFDQLEPQLLHAPGGLFAVVTAQLEQPTVPTDVPCSGMIAQFKGYEMNAIGATDLALRLESRIAELAFAYFSKSNQPPMQEEGDPDIRLARLLRKMKMLGNSRLVCAIENSHEFWYVLQDQKEASVIVGSGGTPEAALAQALR